MFKNNFQDKRIVVQGKKGSYNVPVKALMLPKVKQQHLYEEYWK
jgi:hypothetical protein